MLTCPPENPTATRPRSLPLDRNFDSIAETFFVPFILPFIVGVSCRMCCVFVFLDRKTTVACEVNSECGSMNSVKERA